MVFLRRLYGSYMLVPALLLCLVLSACENDLKKIQELSAQEVKPEEKSTKVEITYSDSNIVKAQVFAPVMILHKVDTPYYEMPKGVKIIFYDKNMQPVNTITSKYAITKNNNNIIELHKNVVATNQQGDVFKSEELIRNGLTKTITSTQPVQLIMANGNISNGTSFVSNETFTHYTMEQSTGIFKVDNSAVQ